ncbi:glycoside hydrolase family 3 C-terminal domain-containing protein [Egicoccus halophilus]|uniref:Exo-alpha-(1->6)-L-arabinopyranosidase n=1 Tax=Egicoccus halophilus TaxID=1670830 RepID=A0A8J3ERA3_9ACTN|nr:glycoside hydrolase family 3 C-terminal domain-containing protein [Egicoccus halophilus]GGI04571.1 glycosyl hydrolase [Egicoccus halophilus]
MTSPTSEDLATQVRLLSGRDNWSTEAVEGHRPVVVADGPHGVRRPDADQLGIGSALPATCFPTASSLAASWDLDLIEQVGAALGRESRARDVDVLLGPGLNLKRHPAGGRNFEYFSEDPLLSGRMAAAMVRGLQSQGVGGCLKHFAVNNQEAGRMVVDVLVDDRTLRELYLTGFEIAVRESAPWTVMCAYNRVGGTYCSDHRWLLTDVLRDEWGFDGVVMSDWGAVNDRAAAVAAGLDLEMPTSGKAFDREVVAAVERGKLDAAAVERSVARLARLAERAESAVADGLAGADDAEAHHVLAGRAAAAGTVLLTNDGILPLASPGRLAVIGGFATRPRYQGAGSSQVTPTRLDTALDAFRDRLGDDTRVAFAPGYALDGSTTDTLVEAAVAAARDADVAVVFAGLPGAYESEGFDRDHLRLPDGHTRLVEAVVAVNPRTVVVLANGAPVELPWADRPAALVEGYLAGQAGGSAIVDVLLGHAEPGGRLAESFPVAAEDLPASAAFPGEPRQVRYLEGLHVGYRFHDTFAVPARFPFGHGGSYTTFAWSEVEVNGAGQRFTVSVTVTNTGERAGSEAVQVYVADVDATVHRPAQELRGFAKVHLAPGEAERVHVDLGPRAFAHWDVERRDWLVAAGTFEVRVAASSVDVRERVRIEVDGESEVPASPHRPEPLADEATFAAMFGREVPDADPVLPLHRNSTLDDLAATPLGRAVQPLLARAASRAMLGSLHEPDAATRRMFATILRESPLRSLVLFGQGRPSLAALDRVLRVLDLQPSRRRR